MIKRFVLAFLAIVGFVVLGGNVAIAADRPVALDGSQQWDMRSVLGNDYRIFVSVPKGDAPVSGWPVLYVLDANEMFLTAVETVRAFEHRPDVDHGRPGTVVVGIGYPPGVNISSARTRDLTPVASTDPRVRGGGGADEFADFVQNELKPALARKMVLDPQRQTIFGHSFGGLWVLHILSTRTEMFQTYLSSSAALWFGDNSVLGALSNFVAGRQPGDRPLRVELSVGEYEQYPAPWAHAPGGDAVAMAIDLKQRSQVGNSRKAAKLLASAPGVEAEFDELVGEDHGSVVPGAISRAVRFLLMPMSVKAPPLPTAREYLDMSPEQRYRLRLQVRELPDMVRIPWLSQLKRTLDAGLSAEEDASLHDERNRMDKVYGTHPHKVNAQ